MSTADGPPRATARTRCTEVFHFHCVPRPASAVVDVTSTDPAAPDETGRNVLEDEFTVLLYEFKVQIAEYLAGLRRTRMRTLADLIAAGLSTATAVRASTPC